MAEVTWDEVGEREFETGISECVLYLPTAGVYDQGFAWNGITGVTETPSGAEATALYADNITYLNLISIEKLGGTVTAYMYPDEWEECDGSFSPVPGVKVSQQNRRVFGLSYKTLIGNDEDGNGGGYKLHLLYGAQAAPSERAYQTVNETPAPIEFSWPFSTTPVKMTGLNPTSLLTINSNDVDPTALASLEEILHGNEADDPRLPLPDEVASIMGGVATATNVVVAGDADSVDITGTTANVLFTVEAWNGTAFAAVTGGTAVNEAAAEALVLANGIHKVTLTATANHFIPVAQQTTFMVNVT